jgi:hypothetical protein
MQIYFRQKMVPEVAGPLNFSALSIFPWKNRGFLLELPSTPWP